MEKFTFFWNRSAFSQWHPSPFVLDGIRFSCCEQAMMYYKAQLFQDQRTATAILVEKSPAKQKSLGRKVHNFSHKIWVEHRENIVYRINYAKFSQNPSLQEKLFQTVGTTLVESSPYDTIWGIGLAKNDPLAQLRDTWKGLNLLGEILTKVRDDLISQSKFLSNR